ncbi:hypothetical protein [Anaeropeptidivorans aminofermentans]|jgi:hypothetical protein|uniref:hypothetical protein n=1 Tax=Anaeropeptidivorans aminofermentans TaxID=2934315 RepID=UPI002B1FF486|nr:hypothetical protein [Anaeropeptidivorans aminofermentans]
MYNNILMHLKRPAPYQQSQVNFWNDEHISKHMLKAHLDPDCEGAKEQAAN